MKKEFVITENDKRFRTSLEHKLMRAAYESNLVTVLGRAGAGKTRTLVNYAASCNAVMLTAYPGWTPRRMMLELAAALGIPAAGEWQQAVDARIAAEEIPVIVDEAGFALINNASCLERLRRITDKSGTLLVIVVMERDMALLCKQDQLTSRATLCHFKPTTLEDVNAACRQLTAVSVAPDLAKRIHHDSTGRMRLVLEAINTTERVALAAGKTSVCAADLAGFVLCETFNSTVLRRGPSDEGGKA